MGQRVHKAIKNLDMLKKILKKMIQMNLFTEQKQTHRFRE